MASFEERGSSIRVVVRIDGGRKKSATFDTRQDAEAWASRMEGRKEKGELKPGSAVTVGMLFEEYLEAHAGTTDTAKWNTLRINKWIRDPLSECRLSAIVAHDINEWIKRRMKDVSGATVNRELNLMSGAFKYAVKVREWITENPVSAALRPPRGRARKKPLLLPAQVQALKQSTGYDADPGLRTKTARVGATFLLSMETGMRSGEILRARPVDYWRDKQTLHVAAIEKGGRKSARSGRASVDPSRNVPLTGEAIRLLDQLLASSPADQPYIVGLSDSQRDSLWRKSVKQAALVDLHFHDMKHEAATRLSRFLDVLELSHALGTKDIRLLRDTYYVNDATRSAARLPKKLGDS